MCTINRILYGLSAVILLIILWPIVILPAQWRWQTQRESVAILSGAKTADDLKKAVGSLGIVIPIRGGSWIAIRYRDTHSLPSTSLAIACDSEGFMFKSTNHFCGQFPIYEHERTLEEDSRAESKELGEANTNTISRPRSETFRNLDSIFEAPSLEIARQHLLKFGFHPLNK
jgi:hypothetical protein